MVFLYDILFILFAAAYLPYVLIRRKWHRGFVSRFGFFSAETAARLHGNDNIWVHAVSVGEVLAVGRMVEGLRARYPEKQIVISTVTRTGNALAKEQYPFAEVIYAPVDFSPSVRTYLKAINPEIYIAAETEIWPNLFSAMRRRGIPVIQVNGRISDKSFRSYKRLGFLLKPVLSCVRCFCMQTEADAQRIIRIGAVPERVYVTGNMKFDEDPERGPAQHGPVFKNAQAPVFAAGSTHPGEEEIVLNIFKRLREGIPGVCLILAPRHVERAGEVAALIKKHGLGFSRFSDVRAQRERADDVLLVDTIGHLRYLYRYASVVFVGKSLTGRGGQNVIEPASLGKPVIVGPHMENFRSARDLLLRYDALVVVENAAELEKAVVSLFSDPARAEALGKNARAAVEEQRGAVARTLECVEKIQRTALF